MGHYQVLTLQLRVDLVLMATEEYPTPLELQN